MSTAPIALFVYNRPEHFLRTAEALAANDLATQSELHVFSDGARDASDISKVAAVRDYCRKICGFKSVSIHCQSTNCGLAASIIDGVTTVCEQHGRVIVLEDDLVVSRHFLRYMNEALDLYECIPEVISIHGYVYPVGRPLPETFFLRGADCWGWATWRRGWRLFNPNGASLLAELESRKLALEFDLEGAANYTQMLREQVRGTNQSWAIRWHASAFLAGKLTLYPGRSLVRNIGFDATGTHCGTDLRYATSVLKRPVRIELIPPTENIQARTAFKQFLIQPTPPQSPNIVRKVARLVGRIKRRLSK